jgi:hypothetical protein
MGSPGRRPLRDFPTLRDDLRGPASDVRQLLPATALPLLATTPEGLHLLPLDAGAAYLLSLVDGTCTIETILDVCEMNHDEALGILVRLLRLGAIRLRDP